MYWNSPLVGDLYVNAARLITHRAQLGWLLSSNSTNLWAISSSEPSETSTAIHKAACQFWSILCITVKAHRFVGACIWYHHISLKTAGNFGITNSIAYLRTFAHCDWVPIRDLQQRTWLCPKSRWTGSVIQTRSCANLNSVPPALTEDYIEMTWVSSISFVRRLSNMVGLEKLYLGHISASDMQKERNGDE